jgi:hypothetical protein
VVLLEDDEGQTRFCRQLVRSVPRDVGDRVWRHPSGAGLPSKEVAHPVRDASSVAPSRVAKLEQLDGTLRIQLAESVIFTVN